MVEFESLDPHVVGEELEAIFGGSAAKTIMWFLNRRHSILKEQMIEKPEDLFATLRSLFGSGADLIEKRLGLK